MEFDGTAKTNDPKGRGANEEEDAAEAKEKSETDGCFSSKRHCLGRSDHPSSVPM